MSLQWVARANVLRHLRLGDGLSHQTRVIGVQNQLRRLSLASSPRSPTPLAGSFSVVKSQQPRSFATDATESTSAKKPKKSTTKKPKAEKKKRELTEKQKEAKAKQENRELVKQLKETALQPPKKLPQMARGIAMQHKLKELQAQSPSLSPTQVFKEAVTQVYTQRLQEADRFVNQAEENRTANEASYEEWLKQYSALQIKQANTARKSLRRLGHSKYPALQDERLVRNPTTSYMWFVKERHESGDFKNLPVKEAASRIADEWKNLTESEKRPYFEKSERDLERYREEYREAYGEDVPTPRTKSSST